MDFSWYEVSCSLKPNILRKRDITKYIYNMQECLNFLIYNRIVLFSISVQKNYKASSEDEIISMSIGVAFHRNIR